MAWNQKFLIASVFYVNNIYFAHTTGWHWKVLSFFLKGLFRTYKKKKNYIIIQVLRSQPTKELFHTLCVWCGIFVLECITTRLTCLPFLLWQKLICIWEFQYSRQCGWMAFVDMNSQFIDHPIAMIH